MTARKRTNTGTQKGQPSKRRAPGPRTKKPLPVKYTDLIAIHGAVATVSALLQRRGIPTNLKTLKATVENQLGGREFTERHLRQLATIDPQSVKLRLQLVQDEDGNSERELSVSLSLNHDHSKKRSLGIGRVAKEIGKLNKNFETRLYDYLSCEFKEYMSWLNEEHQPDDRTSWDSQISLNAPDIPEVALHEESLVRDAEPGDTRSMVAARGGALQSLVHTDWYKDQVVHMEVENRAAPEYAELKYDIHPKVVDGCRALGIEKHKFYKHQAEAVEHLLRLETDVMLATATASGKSLCYNIAAGEYFASDSNATALYIFPTKALARDQLKAAEEFFVTSKLLETGEVQPFDGDVEYGYQRKLVREKARLIVTNPDILHVTVLPKHREWKRFLSGLRLVVIDEAHVYKGAFGIHCAMVIRRLLSLCKREYDANVRMTFCSATVSNAKEHVERLCGRSSIHTVDKDGSAKAARTILIWNPPLKQGAEEEEEDETGWRKRAEVKGSKSIRRSSMFQTARIIGHLMAADKRVIAFSASRKLVEITTKTVLELLDYKGLSHLRSQIRSYRGGYLKTERRKIESALKTGSIQAVVSTNALELGIDIGDLESSVHLGFPGSISALRQQIGRAGRVPRKEASISVLVLMDSPLDQHYGKHADHLFRGLPEAVIIDPANNVLLRKHLVCAVAEKSCYSQEDILEFFGGPGIQEVMDLVFSGEMEMEDGGTFRLTARGKKIERNFSIRFIDDKQITVRVQRSGDVLEQIESSKAMFFVHPGAVYLNSGRTYLVKELDYDEGTATVVQISDNPGYYTSILDKTRLKIISEAEFREIPVMGSSKLPDSTLRIHHGVVDVTTTVYAYLKVNILSGQNLDKVKLDLPPLEYTTSGLWIDIPPMSNFPELNEHSFFAGLHAIEHLLQSLAHLFLLLESSDLSGWTVSLHEGTGRPQIFLHETIPSGVGLIREIYSKHVESILVYALERLETCECGNTQEGCPSCIQVRVQNLHNCWSRSCRSQPYRAVICLTDYTLWIL
uniref:Uncharacterized protein n=1 Tax=Rhodosorus marinus TaxID=101924 RepID=A0A7S3A4S1_9RHOD|mmetsp:Transcript_44773/g.173737  ORF Transcript_44773/g.173737 Transcript_44773/m.173737 type:complete len:1023 (+) Transcript_44773:234-3302(+)